MTTGPGGVGPTATISRHGVKNPPLHWSQTDNVIWKVQVPGHGSPCLWGDAVFLPTADDQAEVQYLLCYDRRTGRQRWQTEVHRKGSCLLTAELPCLGHPGVRRPVRVHAFCDPGRHLAFRPGLRREDCLEFSSPPVLAGGHVYVVNEEGVAFVFKAGRRFELVARNDLGDGGFATPVICGDRIYLRAALAVLPGEIEIAFASHLLPSPVRAFGALRSGVTQHVASRCGENTLDTRP